MTKGHNSMNAPVRVFQVATGNVGSEMIKRIATHRDLELIGLHCYTAEKIGRAGELVGLDLAWPRSVDPRLMRVSRPTTWAGRLSVAVSTVT
jgi:hypothetical protein